MKRVECRRVTVSDVQSCILSAATVIGDYAERIVCKCYYIEI